MGKTISYKRPDGQSVCRLSRRACARHGRAWHGRDPGVVGSQRSDQGRRRQAGGGRLPGVGAGPLPRQGRARGQRSRAPDDQPQLRRCRRPGRARRGPASQGLGQRQGRRHRVLHGWGAHASIGSERPGGGRRRSSGTAIRRSTTSMRREDQGAAHGSLGHRGRAVPDRQGRRAGDEAPRRRREFRVPPLHRRNTPSRTRRRTRRTCRSSSTTLQRPTLAWGRTMDFLAKHLS